MDLPPQSTTIPTRRIAAFQERLILRDPRARTRHPGLVAKDDGALSIAGPFDLRRVVIPTRPRGVRFAEATGDPNPIHREGEVVPGAFLAAQLLSSFEVLLPALRIESLRISFTGICWYARPVRLTMRCTPVVASGQRGLRVEATAWQDEREVSTAVLEGRFEATPARLELPLQKVDTAWLGRVLDFYIALGLDPHAYLQKDEGQDLSYPLGFLASLPSGSMVKRFQGEGGVLNRLTLEFDKRKLPLAGPPEVSLEVPSRIRQSFTKILTFVREGLDTAVRGTALVLPRAPLELLTRRPPGAAPA